MAEIKKACMHQDFSTFDQATRCIDELVAQAPETKYCARLIADFARHPFFIVHEADREQYHIDNAEGYLYCSSLKQVLQGE